MILNDLHITSNFRLSEFVISDSRSASLNFDNVCSFVSRYDELIKPLSKLCSVLQYIRTVYNRPIIITSGYRCPSVNAAVGGVSNSRHLSASACDVVYTSDLADCISRLRKLGVVKLSEFIVKPSKHYIHISID